MVRKKILFINHNPYLRGGGEFSLLSIIKNINSKKFLKEVIVPGRKEFYINCIDNHIPTRSVSISLFNKKIFPINIIRMILFGIIYFKRFDIIYCNSIVSTLLCLIPSMILKKKIIFHMRTPELGSNNNFIKYILTKLLEHCFRIICVSGYIQEILCHFNNKLFSKSKVIYNGIDGSINNKSIIDFRKQYNISKEQFIFAYVGRIIPWKHIEDYIYFIYNLNNNNLKLFKKCSFFIIGDSEFGQSKTYKQKLKDIINIYKLNDKIIWIGFKKNILQIFQKIDFLFLPSIGEAFGRVVIEAMAMSVIVIAKKNGGPKEILELTKTGILYSNIDDILPELYKIINKEKLKKAKQDSYEGYKKFFTLNQMIHDVERIIEL